MNQHQTPQWEHGYDYDKDPLWHVSQKAEKFDRVWFYHCDHLGTPQEMSDQTGAIVWTAEYKAWVSEGKQSTALPEAQDESCARIVNLKTISNVIYGTQRSSPIIFVFKGMSKD